MDSTNEGTPVSTTPFEYRPVTKAKGEVELTRESYSGNPRLLALFLSMGGYLHRKIDHVFGVVDDPPVYEVISTRFEPKEGIKEQFVSRMNEAACEVREKVEEKIGKPVDEITWLPEISVTMGMRSLKVIRILMNDSQVSEYMKRKFGSLENFAKRIVTEDDFEIISGVPNQEIIRTAKTNYLGRDGSYDFKKLQEEDLSLVDKLGLLGSAVERYKYVSLGEGSMRDESAGAPLNSWTGMQGARPDLIGLYAVSPKDTEAVEVVGSMQKVLRGGRSTHLLDALEMPEERWGEICRVVRYINQGRVGLVVIENKTNVSVKSTREIEKDRTNYLDDMAYTMASLAQLDIHAGDNKDAMIPASERVKPGEVENESHRRAVKALLRMTRQGLMRDTCRFLIVNVRTAWVDEGVEEITSKLCEENRAIVEVIEPPKRDLFRAMKNTVQHMRGWLKKSRTVRGMSR